MNTKAIFHCGRGSNLILGIGRENKIFFLTTPAAINFFHQIVKKIILWCKKKSLPTQIQFFDKISTSEKIVDLMKYLKYKHQSIFPCWGRVNFRDRYEKPNIYSKNSSYCQVFFYRIVKK